MKIRLWTLGSLEHNIFPSTEGVNKLLKILEDGRKSGNSIIDIVWGPDLTCTIIDGDEKDSKDEVNN